MKRTVSRMGHSSLQRHFFNIENCWFRFLGVKVFSSRRCFSVGEGVVYKGVDRKTIREKHIEVDFNKFKYYTKRKDVSAYYKKYSISFCIL